MPVLALALDLELDAGGGVIAESLPWLQAWAFLLALALGAVVVARVAARWRRPVG